MKKKLLIQTIFLFAFIKCISQPLDACKLEYKGIRFEKGLSWKKILAKAKQQNKFILVDCYATWCGPCKKMDKDVYPNYNVGEYINSKYISVKVQMDTTKLDDKQKQIWYADAKTFRQSYQINAFPSYLFFSPEGKCVHKGEGYMKVEDFVQLCEDAINPKKQFYTLLENYEKGYRDYSALRYLAESASLFGYSEEASQIGRDYIDNYIFQLPDSSRITKENVQFICEFTKTSSDKGFNLFYYNADKINKVMNDSNFSRNYSDYLISKEEIDPEILSSMKSNNNSPNWIMLRERIAKKYTEEYADRTITASKVRWFEWRNEWTEYAKYSSVLLEKYGNGMSDVEINQRAWPIFLYSSNRQELEIALIWMKQTINKLPVNESQIDSETDTYANLLYKIGFKDEAIKWEKKAIELAIKAGFGPRGDFQDALNKMQRDIPTWHLN